MLTIHLDDKDVCHFNDAWFDLNWYTYTDEAVFKEIIRAIDGVEYLGNGQIVMKFGPKPVQKQGITTVPTVGVQKLSTGCKTALNVYFCPDKIFTIAECGANAVELILAGSQGNIYTPEAILVRDFSNPVRVLNNGVESIVSTRLQLTKMTGGDS